MKIHFSCFFVIYLHLLFLNLGFFFPSWVGFPGGSDGKTKSSCNAGDLGWIPGWEISLEKRMATHSSILAWRIPWTEEPGGLQSKGPERVGHEWITNTFNFFWLVRKSWYYREDRFIYWPLYHLETTTYSKISVLHFEDHEKKFPFFAMRSKAIWQSTHSTLFSFIFRYSYR